MIVLKGKASNLTTISRLCNSFFNLTKPHLDNGPNLPIFLRLRLFSSMDDDYSSSSGHFRKTGSNDYDDKFSGKERRNSSTHQNIAPPQPIPGRPLRGQRQTPQIRGEKNFPDSNYRKNNNFGNGSKPNMKLDDDLFKFDDNDEGKSDLGLGLGGDCEGKSRPSIRELLNAPSKGEEEYGRDGDDFLEKFKLGGDGKKESTSNGPLPKTIEPQEEKIEPPEEADVIFKKMKQTGLIPNAVAMLDGLCKDGLVQEAMKLFGLMREKGSMPEVVVYTAVVDGFCQAQKLDDAKRIFRKMQNNGIVPNAFSYTVLIKGLYKGKRLEDAVDFCIEMLEAGHSPNATTFTGLVHEFCKEKGVEEAQKIIGALKQKGFFLDEKAVRNYLDKTGPTSPMVWEAIFGPKKTTQKAF